MHVFRDIVLDINTFISACFFMIAGVQLVSFGAISRTYGAISGLLPANTRAMSVLRHATTDRLALAGALLAVLGAAGFAYALNAWAMQDFGPLRDPMIPRMVLGGMTLIVIGMQVLFTGFVMGTLAIPAALCPEAATQKREPAGTVEATPAPERIVEGGA
jgi:hypothetical protein